MKNWSNYLDRELTEVLEELSTLGYQVLNDEPGIYSYRNVKLQKDNESVELVCSLNEPEVIEQGLNVPEDAQWWVVDIFENGDSFIETEADLPSKQSTNSI